MQAVWTFQAETWPWEAREGWIFCTVPDDISDEIEQIAGSGRGFGSVRVEARIGASTWRTSLFPSTTEEAYVLPLKKAVRKAEGIDEGSVISVALRLVDG